VQTTEVLYQQYVVAHGLEREALFRLLHERFAPETVLYPGCFLHVTPSFWLQHVVYVDRNELASCFFADAEGVRRLVESRRHYRPSAFLRFLQADYTRPLPLPDASFDLLLALYAPNVSRTCARYLKPGGLLLTNDHEGDAADALRDARLRLVGAFEERRGSFTLREGDMEGYLVPRSAGALKGRRVGGRPIYVRPAHAYLFRRE
jgi:SAM-dependent methyltransferase